MPPNVKPVSDEAPPRYIEDLHESDQSVAILVPTTKNNYSYLRLGDAPDKLEGGLNGDLAKLFKGEASVENMSPGFIHGPDGDLTDFAAEGGWFDLYLGTTYESYIGKASPHEPAGNALPHGDPAQGVDVPLGKYRQEIQKYAAWIRSQPR